MTQNDLYSAGMSDQAFWRASRASVSDFMQVSNACPFWFGSPIISLTVIDDLWQRFWRSMVGRPPPLLLVLAAFAAGIATKSKAAAQSKSPDLPKVMMSPARINRIPV